VLEDTEIRAFLQTEYPRLVNAVAFVTGDLGAAEDAIQEALVRAWIRSERGEEIDSLAAWVVTVALNLTRSRWRRVLTERRIATSQGPSRIEAEDGGADHVDIQLALADLPRRQREVTVLRYFLRMSTQETADALGVSEGTVKNSLSKARAALANSLRIDDQEEHDVQA
jgi:RNA polymerase sigma-70 factor (sigma-E family)